MEKLYNLPVVISPPSLGSEKLNLAKEAFITRKFVYTRQEGNFHYWETQQGDEEVLLWEQNGNVWIRAISPNLGIPTEDTLITDIWDDTGILPPIPATGLPVNEKILPIREGKLSPLVIKRPSPVLEKTDEIKRVYEPLDKNIEKIERIFTSNARIIGLTVETQTRNNYELEAHILNTGQLR